MYSEVGHRFGTESALWPWCGGHRAADAAHATGLRSVGLETQRTIESALWHASGQVKNPIGPYSVVILSREV